MADSPQMFRMVTPKGPEPVDPATINALVDRFLTWPLPKSVLSDGHVRKPDYPHQRTGTNLLTADEARQMFEYLLNNT